MGIVVAPVIIPIQGRECMMVYGKRFCESKPMDAHDGAALLIIIAWFAVTLCLTYRLFEWKHGGKVLIAWIALPVVLFAIALILAGGE